MIFDIQRYATKDGPGIRTLVFFKGCPLRCAWCANPESQSQATQILYDASRCAGCGRCAQLCPTESIQHDPLFGWITQHENCVHCAACVDGCNYGARKLSGKSLSVESLMEIIRKDIPFYRHSTGGVTFSGGEPLMQSDYLYEVLQQCKAERIHTAVETCGYVPWASFEQNLPGINLLFFDFKHIDESAHKRSTGVGVSLIKSNLIKAHQSIEELIIRIPVIPGFNNTPSVIQTMLEWTGDNCPNRWIELLPYHRLGISKYRGLGRNYGLQDVLPLKGDDLEPYQEIGQKMGLQIRIGSQ